MDFNCGGVDRMYRAPQGMTAAHWTVGHDFVVLVVRVLIEPGAPGFARALSASSWIERE